MNIETKFRIDTTTALPVIDRNNYAEAKLMASRQTLQTQFFGKVITTQINSKGVSLPVPFQIELEGSYVAGITTYEMSHILAKASRNRQPSFIHRPKAQFAVRSPPVVDILMRDDQAVSSQEPTTEAQAPVTSPASIPSGKLTIDSFTQVVETQPQEKSSTRNQENDSVPTDIKSNSDQDLTMKKLKKDALWKPLLRSFRAFLRHVVKIKFDSAKRMFWPDGKLKAHAKNRWLALLKQINAPEDYKENERCQQALAILLAPVSGGRLESFFESVPPLVEHIKKTKAIYSTIFRENSIKLRKEFFSDKFI